MSPVTGSCRVSGGRTGGHVRRRLAIAIAAILSVPAAGAADALIGGLYRIEVRTELPNVRDTGSARAWRPGVWATGLPGPMGLAVLGANNPLARCPARNVVRSANRLRFDIVCPGGNAARGSAAFVLSGDRFRGRIEMKLGGKNMTMSEVQTGRRIGDCP